ncbi:uncharacterized protein LOC131436596 [Malaya genurostris]|uniref:uncharacterized protein LOC131436596 n=1 Tax=Malaya genurostris TaxID=325434 RepID=UPI0026F3AF0B|nr:uncharacterized protein LOC131436596 [Malaya genurostris]
MSNVRSVVLLIMCAIFARNIVCQKSSSNNQGKSTSYKIRLTKAVCINQPYEVAWNVTCRLKLVRDQPSKMLFSVTVDQIDQLYLTFAMYYKYQVTYQPLLMDTTFDVCRTLKKYNSRSKAGTTGLDLTAMFVIGILEKNQPALIKTGCPFRGVIQLDNFIIDETMAPKFLPGGDYRLDMHYYNEKNQTVMYSQVFGSVRAVGITDLSMG